MKKIENIRFKLSLEKFFFILENHFGFKFASCFYFCFLVCLFFAFSGIVFEVLKEK